MGRVIGIGKQSFEELRKNNCFYVDKTDFIRQWWELQGTYPVIYLSFADVKQENYEDAVAKIKKIITGVFQQNIFLVSSDKLTRMQKIQFEQVNSEMNDVIAQSSLQDLTQYLYQYYGKKVLILLDEFDTPMQEAYLHGYWDRFTSFIRSF